MFITNENWTWHVPNKTKSGKNDYSTVTGYVLPGVFIWHAKDMEEDHSIRTIWTNHFKELDCKRVSCSMNIFEMDLNSKQSSKRFKGFAVNIGTDKISFSRNFSPDVGIKARDVLGNSFMPQRRSPNILPVKFSKLMLVEWGPRRKR